MTKMTIAIYRKNSKESGWTSVRMYDNLEDALHDAAEGEEDDIIFELESTKHVVGRYREPEKIPEEFRNWQVDVFVDQEPWRL